MRLLFLMILMSISISKMKASSECGVPLHQDSLSRTCDTVRSARKTDFLHSVGNFFTRIFRGFNDIDTAYIEPQHYNYSFMMQNTNTYEEYTLKSKSGQSVTFAPKPTIKVGPYIGWRWFFIGYTFDVDNFAGGGNKKEFDLSLYSSLLGLDLYYRKSGDNYRIISTNVLGDKGRESFRKVAFSGINSSIKGFDVYYIFNHKKFSYPAAFSQSTCQKRSCGSPLVGVGYTSHSISLDYEELEKALQTYGKTHFGMSEDEVALDSGLMFRNVKYSSISVSGGYAYNWVFMKNCLFSASLSLAIAYKESEADQSSADDRKLKAFNFNNFNLDGIGRFGVVWNNKKWYVGASSVLHTYNYKKSRFSSNGYFGSFNIYAGVNFGKKREYK